MKEKSQTMVKKMNTPRTEHRRSMSFTVYEVGDEDTRFEKLIKALSQSRSLPNLEFIKLLAQPGWKHGDRPDWINEQESAAIEDVVVEDARHFLDKHLATRRTKMEHDLKKVSKKKRQQLLKDQGLRNTDNFPPVFAFHIPSEKTAKENNAQRSISNWQESLKTGLEKHRKLMNDLPYQHKALYIYDVTPPYLVKNYAIQKGFEIFDPTQDKGFVTLFYEYPATIIWYMCTQKKIAILAPEFLRQLKPVETDYGIVEPAKVLY